MVSKLYAKGLVDKAEGAGIHEICLFLTPNMRVMRNFITACIKGWETILGQWIRLVWTIC
ncbi:MAG: hypothetical protein K6A81_02975 [Clostridiales bacterium]|nr:hypothetical protein [Clostridiales bacterium]